MLSRVAPVAVVDVETTGVYATTDRIVEIAIVRLGPAGEVVDTYETLVDPQRDVGPTNIHGIRASDVRDAPSFTDVIGDVLALLRGALLCGHNVSFDLHFLGAECARIGLPLPAVSSACTLRLSRTLGFPLPRRNLAACCEHAGIELTDAHSAMGDARATAQLFQRYLRLADELGRREVAERECTRVETPWWPEVTRTGARLTRTQVTPPGTEDAGNLGRWLARLEPGSELDIRLHAYFEVLTRALEDRRITDAEAAGLYQTALRYDLRRDDVTAAHRHYLRALAVAALADGVISDAEREDFLLVARMLGLTAEDRHAAISAAEHARVRAQAAVPAGSALAGLSVCFTGTLLACIDGEPMTRAQAHVIAERAGMKVAERVTKGLDVLVVADPDTMSVKARKAREYGTRIIAERAFWNMIGAGCG